MKEFLLPACVCVASLTVLAGCAATDSRLGPSSRKGTLAKFYSSEQLQKLPSTCLGPLSPDDIVTKKFVEIRVFHGKSSEYLPALLPPSVLAKIGDKVEFSPKHCGEGNALTIIQILE